MSSSMSSTTSSLAFNPDPNATANANNLNRKKTLFSRVFSTSSNELVLSPTHLETSEPSKPIGRKVSQSISYLLSASLGVTGVAKVIIIIFTV